MFRLSLGTHSNRIFVFPTWLANTLLCVWVLVLFWLLVIFLDSLWEVTYGLLKAGSATSDKSVENLRNLGITLGAVLGAPAVVWRLLLTADGQITERFSRAVEQLSSTHEKEAPNIEARVGALHALERISKDSLTDHLAVTAVICAYVRMNTSSSRRESRDANPTAMRIDIDTALNALFDRRSKSLHNVEIQKNFFCNLSGLCLPKARLVQAKLWWVDFEGADLRESNLTGAYLTNACLNQADLRKACLAGCHLDGCTLRGTDLSTVEGLEKEMLDTTYGVKNGEQKTLLPGHIPEPPTHWYDYEEEVRERGPESARTYGDAYCTFIGAKPNQPSRFLI